jgi:aldose 1-epimerase
VSVRCAPFGRTRAGEPVEAFELRAGALRVTLLGYGAALARLELEGDAGRAVDVVLGFETLEGYEASRAHVGGVVGRYANRIAGARFVLDGAEHALVPNEGRHQLHGGPVGFDRRVWRGAPLAGGAPGVAFELESADGDQGFPGRLLCRARYEIVGERELALVLEASAERATPVSLTQHGYWQLGGPGAGSALGHVLELAADRYLPVDAEHLPAGPLRDVAGTPFDFRRPRPLDPGRDLAHPELAAFGGYDHPFALRRGEGALRPAARAVHPPSGRALALETTAPCLQLYGGQFLAAGEGKRGWLHGPSAGFCLEPQSFPDAPNRPDLPSAILRPGEIHRQETRYRLEAP